MKKIITIALICCLALATQAQQNQWIAKLTIGRYEDTTYKNGTYNIYCKLHNGKPTYSVFKHDGTGVLLFDQLTLAANYLVEPLQYKWFTITDETGLRIFRTKPFNTDTCKP